MHIKHDKPSCPAHETSCTNLPSVATCSLAMGLKILMSLVAHISGVCKRSHALDVSEFKNFRINHHALFAQKYKHIHGIENFWNQAKQHMRKFNGIPRQHFNHLFLEECEWRFNMVLPRELLKDLKKLLKENY